MPRRYQKGGESRLSIEGLKGKRIDGAKVASIWAHGEKRKTRTVIYKDGSIENRSIYDLVGKLIDTRK